MPANVTDRTEDFQLVSRGSRSYGTFEMTEITALRIAHASSRSAQTAEAGMQTAHMLYEEGGKEIWNATLATQHVHLYYSLPLLFPKNKTGARSRSSRFN